MERVNLDVNKCDFSGSSGQLSDAGFLALRSYLRHPLSLKSQLEVSLAFEQVRSTLTRLVGIFLIVCAWEAMIFQGAFVSERVPRVFGILNFEALERSAFAQEGLLNKLLAPGPLIEPHSELEHKDCLECHEAGSGVPDSKCLACHKEIQASIDRRISFHGKAKKRCHECHADHKGRKYNTLKFDEKEFDHKSTGYELFGKHAKIECKKCHTETRAKKDLRRSETRWFGKERGCLECHKKDDVHFFQDKYKGKECSECHSQVGWKQTVDFDHFVKGGYALKGKHQNLKCEKCHAPSGKASAKYSWNNFKAKKCLNCHKDVHGNNLSTKFQKGNCEKCHSQQRWPIKNFSHEITGFRLKGKHARVDCTQCHKQKPKSKPRKKFKWIGLEKACTTCHKDFHAFLNQKSKRFGPLSTCDRCHSNESFKSEVDFNHSLDTRFKIDGKHRKNKCFDCHKPAAGQSKRNPKKRIYRWSQLERKTCETCHKSPHRKQFPPKLLRKKCTECHVTSGWNVIRKGKGSGFSHDATRFPLSGRHKKVKCDTCHIKNGKQRYKFPFAEKQFCQACHKGIHKRQFHKQFASKSCAECHTTTRFSKLKPFNHNKTRFKLTGKHKKIRQKCQKCHVKTSAMLATKPPRRAGKYKFGDDENKFCQQCHKSVHVKQFDRKFRSMPCGTCHVTTTFSKRKKFDHTTTRFEIKGSHKKLKCAKCHVKTKNVLKRNPVKFASKFTFSRLGRSSCRTCHTDPHHGTFGVRCAQCHNEERWKSTRDFHRNFDLSGVHYVLQCEECHIDNRRLGGLSHECLVCHQKDDVHNASLPTCSNCHRQTFWETTKFNHGRTLFPLRGAHRVQTCGSCHLNGAYTGRPSACVDCHSSDRKIAITPLHTSSLFNNCEECHNEFSFSGAVGGAN